jgi:hypothetical protein
MRYGRKLPFRCVERLVDRNFLGFDLVETCMATGADLLWRAKSVARQNPSRPPELRLLVHRGS